MRVRYFALGIISVFLTAAFVSGIFIVYRNSTDVVSRDGGVTVWSENENEYIIGVKDKTVTLSLFPEKNGILGHILTPEALKADISIYSFLRDIYIDFLKNLEEKA